MRASAQTWTRESVLRKDKYFGNFANSCRSPSAALAFQKCGVVRFILSFHKDNWACFFFSAGRIVYCAAPNFHLNSFE